jgi:hypothetical protein
LNSHKELIIGRYLILVFNSIIKVYTSQSTISMDFYILTLHKSATKCFLTIFLKIKYYFIPPFIQLQWKRAFKRFDSGNRLIIAWYKCSFNVFIVQHCHFESKILVQLIKSIITFFTSKTSIGIFILIEPCFSAGKEI